MKKITIILSFMILSVGAFATVQEADLLIVGTDTVFLNSFPLDSLNLAYRPYGHTRQTAPSTSCWRGYRAIWKIVDNKLYLESIIRCQNDSQNGEQNIKELFNKNGLKYEEKEGMILADWVSMNFYSIEVPNVRNYSGKLHVFGGYDEKEKNKYKKLRLKIEKGNITFSQLEY